MLMNPATHILTTDSCTLRRVCIVVSVPEHTSLLIAGSAQQRAGKHLPWVIGTYNEPHLLKIIRSIQPLNMVNPNTIRAIIRVCEQETRMTNNPDLGMRLLHTIHKLKQALP